MAPAQGWHAQIEKCNQFVAPLRASPPWPTPWISCPVRRAPSAQINRRCEATPCTSTPLRAVGAGRSDARNNIVNFDAQRAARAGRSARNNIVNFDAPRAARAQGGRRRETTPYTSTPRPPRAPRAGRFVGSFVGSLVRWLVGSLVTWLVGGWVGGRHRSCFGSLACWLVGSLVIGLVGGWVGGRHRSCSPLQSLAPQFVTLCIVFQALSCPVVPLLPTKSLVSLLVRGASFHSSLPGLVLSLWTRRWRLLAHCQHMPTLCWPTLLPNDNSQGHPNASKGALASKNPETGPGWRQSKQYWVLSAGMGRWVGVWVWPLTKAEDDLLLLLLCPLAARLVVWKIWGPGMFYRILFGDHPLKLERYRED